MNIDKNKCVSCGACVVVCTVGAIKLCDGIAVINNATCIGCEKCINKCIRNAIKR